MVETLLVLILLALWQQNATPRDPTMPPARWITTAEWWQTLDPSTRGLLFWIAAAIAVAFITVWVGRTI